MLDILFLWVTLTSKRQVVWPLSLGRINCVTNFFVTEAPESESSRPLAQFRSEPSRCRHALEPKNRVHLASKTALAQGVLQTTVTMVSR
jgi:hypothetical protein